MAGVDSCGVRGPGVSWPLRRALEAGAGDTLGDRAGGWNLAPALGSLRELDPSLTGTLWAGHVRADRVSADRGQNRFPRPTAWSLGSGRLPGSCPHGPLFPGLRGRSLLAHLPRRALSEASGAFARCGTQLPQGVSVHCSRCWPPFLGPPGACLEQMDIASLHGSDPWPVWADPVSSRFL